MAASRGGSAGRCAAARHGTIYRARRGEGLSSAAAAHTAGARKDAVQEDLVADRES